MRCIALNTLAPKAEHAEVSSEAVCRNTTHQMVGEKKAKA